MARIYQGILGPYSGKCGAVVGGSWKGIATQKGYQPIVANPRTAAQIANRDQMANVVAFARVLLASVIKPLWDRFASKMSGYNAFVSRNKDLFEDAFPTNPGALITSQGKMDATPITVVTAAAGSGSVKVDWGNDAGVGFKLATDKAYIVVLNEATGKVYAFNTGVSRSALTATVVISPVFIAGTVLFLYLSFLREDGTVVSNNSYKDKSIA